jgi:hypothetical protein
VKRLVTVAALAASTAFATAAFAQMPPGAQAYMGVLTAVSPDSVTIQLKDGTTKVLPLAQSAMVSRSKPVDVDTIKPGSYVATANTNIDANSGKSIELRTNDSGAGQPAFSGPMSEPNTTLTNGTVQTVTKGENGRELVVAYPGGSRHIIVPSDVKVIGDYPATRQDLSVGQTVAAMALPDAQGHLAGMRIMIQPW